jgi:hypothetical protein
MVSFSRTVLGVDTEVSATLALPAMQRIPTRSSGALGRTATAETDVDL